MAPELQPHRPSALHRDPRGHACEELAGVVLLDFDSRTLGELPSGNRWNRDALLPLDHGLAAGFSQYLPILSLRVSAPTPIPTELVPSCTIITTSPLALMTGPPD